MAVGNGASTSAPTDTLRQGADEWVVCLGCMATREPGDDDRDCACVLGGFSAPAGEGVLDAENFAEWRRASELDADERALIFPTDDAHRVDTTSSPAALEASVTVSCLICRRVMVQGLVTITEVEAAFRETTGCKHRPPEDSP